MGMLTKPASVFAQILGTLMAFGLFGGDATSTVVGTCGIALFIWGGWSARRRIRLDQAN